jgi:DNA-binding MarR family transcriptional regulator
MPLDHQSSPGFAVGRTAHLFRQAVRHVLEDVASNLSSEEAQLLIALSSVDEPIRVGDFAKIVMRDATTLTRQIDGLIEKGFAAREPAAEDRRVMLISLTSRGAKELERVLPYIEVVRQTAIDGITSADMTTTIKTLQRMQRNLSSDVEVKYDAETK